MARIITTFARIFVGVLFIISGLIKLNDPLGFSYKLQEYFSESVLNLPALEPYALMISILVVIFEVILGVFLLIGYKPKFTVWSLLATILFFTFLTFYSAYFDKVRDCGCFGDALKLTPWQSFYKDIILGLLILVILRGVKFIKPIFKPLKTSIIALLSFVFSLWFAYHVLMHLPVIDFRAYKIGNNIKTGMTTPKDAPKPVIEYRWKFDHNGTTKTVVTDGAYPDVKGDFVTVTTKVLKAGYEPPVVDFSIESKDADLTDTFLNKDKLVMIVAYDLNTIEAPGAEKLKSLQDRALSKGYTVIGLTASSQAEKTRTKERYHLTFDFYLCDEKALKTIVRSNPGVLVLNQGTIEQKVHWNDIETLKL